MLRITSDNTSNEYLLKLEGCLVGAWVPELAACWREVSGRVPRRVVRVDLTEVSRVDAAGRELMTLMYRAGVQFVAKGFVIPELLREISDTVDNRKEESCLP
jgi:ABC-type transporter Mla MlaB component